ncbi:MAG: hypothetical protein E7122_01565 [Bacteroidales bacterium]|nr:hypothetical protein [Bacteroidales bacterium]
MKRTIFSFLACTFLLAASFCLQAQENVLYKITNKGVVKYSILDGKQESLNVIKPILIFKTRYEMDTEEGYSRFSVKNARLGVQGDLSKMLSYKFMVDFSAENKLSVLDLYAVLKPSKRLSFTLGQQGLSLFNSWAVSPNSVDYVNRPFIGKYFISSRDIGLSMKYALKNQGFPINAELGVYNGTGINNPTWNKSVAVGGRLEFGSTKKGFRTSAKFYNLKNADGFTDTYWGADVRYAGSDFKIEAEYMTKELNDRNPGALNAAYIQGMYKIKVNDPSISRIEPVLRWDGMGYDITDRGLGVNRITVGANLVFKTTSFTNMLRINYEHYFNNSMDLSALFKTPIYNSDKLSLEYLLYF